MDRFDGVIPPCPQCGLAVRVEPLQSELGRWICHGCSQPFDEVDKLTNNIMKRFLCWLIGHKPRGPVVVSGLPGYVLYRCERCNRLIRFNSEKGWMVWKNIGR